jgi:hypothetical protein
VWEPSPGRANAATSLTHYDDESVEASSLLFDDDLDGVADRINEAISRAAEDSLGTERPTTLRALGSATL